jgi:hypothetical protein
MLTATYSIVALKLEQSRARWTFSSIQQYILNSINNIKSAGAIDFEGMLNRLAQFEQTCHQRKMEVFVIPALRRFTHEADALLDELESLSETSLALLCSLRNKLKQALRQGGAMVEEICASLEQCCKTLYRRLTREEELVQIAERALPSEAWFGIAADFMSHDARMTKAMAPVHDDEEE